VRAKVPGCGINAWRITLDSMGRPDLGAERALPQPQRGGAVPPARAILNRGVGPAVGRHLSRLKLFKIDRAAALQDS
jgi:hypothetical protein